MVLTFYFAGQLFSLLKFLNDIVQRQREKDQKYKEVKDLLFQYIQYDALQQAIRLSLDVNERLPLSSTRMFTMALSNPLSLMSKSLICTSSYLRNLSTKLLLLFSDWYGCCVKCTSTILAAFQCQLRHLRPVANHLHSNFGYCEGLNVWILLRFMC